MENLKNWHQVITLLKRVSCTLPIDCSEGCSPTDKCISCSVDFHTTASLNVIAAAMREAK